jgi:hypothetical protein
LFGGAGEGADESALASWAGLSGVANVAEGRGNWRDTLGTFMGRRGMVIR